MERNEAERATKLILFQTFRSRIALDKRTSVSTSVKPQAPGDQGWKGTTEAAYGSMTMLYNPGRMHARRLGVLARATACACVVLACVLVAPAAVHAQQQGSGTPTPERLKIGVTVNNLPMEIVLAPTDDPTRVATGACTAAFPLPTPGADGVLPADDSEELRRDCVRSLSPLVARKQGGDYSVRGVGVCAWFGC